MVKGFSESERSVALLGALVLACALTITVAWDLHVRAQRDELRSLVTKNASTGTPQQLASDTYHLGHFEASLASRWSPGDTRARSERA